MNRDCVTAEWLCCVTESEGAKVAKKTERIGSLKLHTQLERTNRFHLSVLGVLAVQTFVLFSFV
ncbi:MAG: hypothetical protein C4576_30045 [Desulfobacteraceae bacterium]|nr:MAG: hypothetical protein C4576_30045 [Desulfobacteraceae bacterium]